MQKDYAHFIAEVKFAFTHSLSIELTIAYVTIWVVKFVLTLIFI